MSYQDPSNQAVNIFTRLLDFSLKTIGSITKHVSAAFYAVYRDHRNGNKLPSGKVKLKKLLKSSSEHRMFTLEGKKAIKKFKKFARKYHIPYSAQKEKGKKTFNITIRGEDAARVKYMLGENLELLNVEKKDIKLKGGVVKLDELLQSGSKHRMFTIKGKEAMQEFKKFAEKNNIPFAFKKQTEDGKTYYNMSIRGEDVAITQRKMGEKLNFTEQKSKGEITEKSIEENQLKSNSKEQVSKDINMSKTSETIEKTQNSIDTSKASPTIDKPLTPDITKSNTTQTIDNAQDPKGADEHSKAIDKTQNINGAKKPSETIEKLEKFKDDISKGENEADKVLDKDIDIELPSKD